MKRNLSIILVIIVSISCSPISQEIMKQVDQTLSLKEVLKNADQYKGKMVLWGGVIVETVNKPEGTLIIVTQTALGYETRPINHDQSEGRFIVKKTGILDPAIYEKGREITVAGEISGKEELPLGEIKYTYPVVTATQLILWEKLTYSPYYYEPLYWYPWYWYPYPGWSQYDRYHDHDHRHHHDHGRDHDRGHRHHK